MRIHRDERGQTILLVALSLPLLLGFVGIATDVGALFKDKRTLQTAADAAAIAGALNLNAGTYVTAAKDASKANGFTDGSNNVTVTVNDPPTWPTSSYVGANGYVEVTVTKIESTIFLSLFGYPSITVLARAVATLGGPSAACIYTIGTPPGPALTVNGGSIQSQSPPCGLIVDSSNSPPMNVTGTLTMKSIGTVGDCAGSCGTGMISPMPVSGIIPYSDPLSFLPQVSTGGCAAGLNLTGTQNPSPGCYNGLSATGTYAITLQPGIYIINGPLSLSGGGTFSGAGVTIIMANGSVGIGPNNILNLSAPNSPGSTYNGILFAQSSSNTAPATIAIDPASTLQGILYFPDAPLTITPTGLITNLYTDFVAQSLTVNNNLAFSDYASLPGVTSSPLSSVVLVE